jgi:hypothetical protein
MRQKQIIENLRVNAKFIDECEANLRCARKERKYLIAQLLGTAKKEGKK